LLICEGEDGSGYAIQTPLASCQKWYIEIVKTYWEQGLDVDLTH
jgi:hypothetical protein